jgi:hypothetical protein
MQDAAAFYRNRARSSFNRRRKYPVNSEDRKQAVEEVRMFIRALRAMKREAVSDLTRIDRMTDDDIDYSDIHELDDEFFTKPTVEWPPKQ